MQCLSKGQLFFAQFSTQRNKNKLTLIHSYVQIMVCSSLNKVIYTADCYDNWSFLICDLNAMFEKKEQISKMETTPKFRSKLFMMGVLLTIDGKSYLLHYFRY